MESIAPVDEALPVSEEEQSDDSFPLSLDQEDVDPTDPTDPNDPNDPNELPESVNPVETL